MWSISSASVFSHPTLALVSSFHYTTGIHTVCMFLWAEGVRGGQWDFCFFWTGVWLALWDVIVGICRSAWTCLLTCSYNKRLCKLRGWRCAVSIEIRLIHHLSSSYCSFSDACFYTHIVFFHLSLSHGYPAITSHISIYYLYGWAL